MFSAIAVTLSIPKLLDSEALLTDHLAQNVELRRIY